MDPKLIKTIQTTSLQASDVIIDATENYSPKEAHLIVLNSVVRLATLPLEMVPPEDRQQVIEETLSYMRQAMEHFDKFLRREQNEEN